MRILVLDSLFDSLDLEAGIAGSHGATLDRWTGDRKALREADIVAHVRTQLDADLIAEMKRCRVITRFGTGSDTVDIRAAKAAGIAVVTVRDYCIVELCSHTLGLAFALTRRLHEVTDEPDATWQTVARTIPIDRYARAAVVGLGSVGLRVASALKALGHEVVAVTRTPERAHEIGAPTATLDDALADSDIVFLHCVLDASTQRLIDARRLALLRRGAILVNTARLGLIDEAAAAAALEDERLGGLALDAYLAADSPLRRLQGNARLLVTPHLGWYSAASADALRRAAILDALEQARKQDEMEVSKQ